MPHTVMERRVPPAVTVAPLLENNERAIGASHEGNLPSSTTPHRPPPPPGAWRASRGYAVRASRQPSGIAAANPRRAPRRWCAVVDVALFPVSDAVPAAARPPEGRTPEILLV